MSRAPRVAIVAHRFGCPGGIQTCFLELIEGLAESGVVPEVVWDEPTDWAALGQSTARAAFGGGRLGIRSTTLRRLPAWLSQRVRPISLSHARLDLERFDFVYNFEDEVRMPPGGRNLVLTVGPPFIRIPGEIMVAREALTWAGMRSMAARWTRPAGRPDEHSSYVTLSEWIADLFERRWRFRPPVIWPPARSRSLPSPPERRKGFLFLSRLQEAKNVEYMLVLAKAFPQESVSIAGGVAPVNAPYVERMRRRIDYEGLSNVAIIENPTEETVARLLVSHAFFVFPAAWEHFGIVNVEAIQAGLFPIVHDTGGPAEIVPIPSLRFRSLPELVARTDDALRLPVSRRKEIVDSLQVHVARGSAARYRKAMLRPLMDRIGPGR